jgi:ABC-type lipoprotein release transport system permease subunit
MNTWTFALRSLVRQPARAALAVLGVAAVGALLFDMLLLSRGLLVSFRDLLDCTGFDVRVMATDTPFGGPRITNASAAAAAIARLPEVEDVASVRYGRATTAAPAGPSLQVGFMGIDYGTRRPWRLLAGQDLGAPDPQGPPPLVVNRKLAETLRLLAGSAIVLRANCSSREPISAPAVRFHVAGIVEFPFDAADALGAATGSDAFRRACGLEQEEAEMLLVAARPRSGPEAAVKAIEAIRPDLHAFSNADMMALFERIGFSYFRQISTVLAAVTLLFALLLITVLLTVSVNQRFAELAALRALGFARARLVADVFCQSALLVGTGGVLAVPLGFALAQWLERILHAMPFIPASVRFFSFEPRALVLHAGLLAITAVLAAVYPTTLVARLPIAATLRNEAVT